MNIELSPRQREVLLLIGQGLTDQEIADRLGLGIKTVIHHGVEIRLKLNLNRKVQLVIYCYENGLIVPNDVNKEYKR